MSYFFLKAKKSDNLLCGYSEMNLYIQRSGQVYDDSVAFEIFSWKVFKAILSKAAFYPGLSLNMTYATYKKWQTCIPQYLNSTLMSLYAHIIGSVTSPFL